MIQVSGCQFPFKMSFEYKGAHGHAHHHHAHTHAAPKAVIGKPAPDFALGAVRNGEIVNVKLADFKGKWLVLFFYPLDFTFVCPTEIIAFADRAGEFRKINTELAAVSVDSVFTHLAWTKTPRKSGGLGAVDIPLLSDINKAAATAYGVLVPDGEDAGVSYRGLFIISPTGVLRQITINDLPVGRSVDETLRLVQAFQFTDEHGEVCPANWHPGAATMKADPKGSQAYFSKANN